MVQAPPFYDIWFSLYCSNPNKKRQIFIQRPSHIKTHKRRNLAQFFEYFWGKNTRFFSKPRKGVKRHFLLTKNAFLGTSRAPISKRTMDSESALEIKLGTVAK